MKKTTDGPDGFTNDVNRNDLAETLRAGFARVADSPHRVALVQPELEPSSDQTLWRVIKSRTELMGFDVYMQFIDNILRGSAAIGANGKSGIGLPDPVTNLPDALRSIGIFGTDGYRLLRIATELFLMAQCSTLSKIPKFIPSGVSVDEENAKVEDLREQYLQSLTNEGPRDFLPYIKLVVQNLGNLPLKDRGIIDSEYGILRSRATGPILLELIWSYWHEQAMLVQSINAVSLRFQNIRRHVGRDPLAALELDSLRPLSNILWGYLQDEQNRLTVVRRAYEYDHEYGLRLEGKAIPEMNTADSRQRFIPAFHNLLYRAWQFLKEDAIRTIEADGFPVLNALRELHFVLAEGAHNQFGDLPWQARIEMLIQMWILARPEMAQFLGGRPAVPYPEPWMDRVDTMKSMQGWTDVSVIHFNDLAVFGEQLILSARYGDWSTQGKTAEEAANWARAWRNEINRYIHAYRVATGVDLTMDTVGAVPAALRDAQPRILSRGAGGALGMTVGNGGVPASLPSPAIRAGLPEGTAVPITNRLPKSVPR
jgi:hypothetical protein